MKYYDEFELVAPATTHYDHHSDESIPLNFGKLHRASLREDMNPLDTNALQNYPFGVATLGVISSTRSFEHKELLAYAGVPDFENHVGMKLAVIGGLIVMPSARKAGLGSLTIKGVLETAGTDEAIEQHGHEGFKVVCNEESEGVFAKHGFVKAGLERGKQVMVKKFNPKT